MATTRKRTKHSVSSPLELCIRAILDLEDRLRWIERTDVMAQNRLILGEAELNVYSKLRKLQSKSKA